MQHIYWIHIKPVWVGGAGDAIKPPDFVRLVYLLSTGGQIMPTKLILNSPPPIFRPSCGPANAAYVESASSKSKSSSLLFWFILRFSFCFSRNTFKGLRQGQLECVLRYICPTTNRWSKLQQYLFFSNRNGL